MIWLRSIRPGVLVLAVVCGMAVVTVTSDFSAGSPHAAHPAGSQCPDPGSNRAPSATDCACVCCPGRVPVSLPHEIGVKSSVLPVWRHPALPADELQPDDLVQSIFHPPRRLTPA